MYRSFMLVFLLFLLCGVVSCKGVSGENYDKLEVGMEYDEVVSILGKADSCRAVLNMKNCIWSRGDEEIRIKFVGSQMVFKAARGLEP